MEEAREHGTAGIPGPAGAHPGAGWRAWAVSILVAIVLSVAATLLLGGDLFFGTDGPEPGGFGHHAACCPVPPNSAEGGR
jgi:hypothetical protein